MEAPTQKLKTLTDALEKIFLKESTKLSFVQGYSDCYTIVIHNMGENLYNCITNIISEHLRGRVQPVITKELSNNGLEILNKNWEDLDACVKKIHDILLFLDCNYAQPQSLLEVYDIGLHNFRDLIVRDKVVSKAMQHVMCGMIIAERQGHAIDRSAIKTAVDLLLSIGEQNNPYSEYDKIFEEEFLNNSKLFYEREVQELLQNNNAIQYLQTFENRLAEEKQRISRYLHKRTENKILELVEEVLIKKKLNEIIHLEFGLNWMIQENRTSELVKIYNFFKKYSLINEFNQLTGQCFSVYANSIVDCVGGDIITKEKSEIIEKLLNLRSKFENLAEKCFENNIELKSIVDNMFTIAMNSKPKTSEYLACYMHEKLKQYEKNSSASESEIDKEIDRFIELFKLVTEKDVFEKYYSANLAKRLLSLKANLDTENKFIGKLQLECGNDFIKSLKNMTKDVTINQTHLELFHNETIAHNIDVPEIDFSIYILFSLAWPRFEQYPEVKLPKSMEQIYKRYLQCYHDKHTGRKVTLQYNMGYTQMKARYDGPKKKREYILEGSTLHAIILDLFNDTTKLSFNEMQAKTDMPERSLNIILTQLVENKILNLEEKNSIKIYSVNLGFSPKTRRYKIRVSNVNAAFREEQRKDNDKMSATILEGRKYEIEAAIVRVMKTRKTLKMAVLQAEIIDTLKNRFTPSVDLIKLKIKYLIEREYIAYAADDTTTIIYME